MMSFESNHTGLTVRRVDKLSQSDAARLFDWGEDLWEIDRYGLTWRPWTWRFVGYLDDEPVSHAGVLTHVVTVGDREIRIGGIAAVLTLPHARGKGNGGKTLLEAVRFLAEEEGVPFALLFCRDPLRRFYEPMGWRKVAGPVIIQQPGQEAPSPLNCMVLQLSEDPWPDGVLKLNSEPW